MACHVALVEDLRLMCVARSALIAPISRTPL